MQRHVIVIGAGVTGLQTALSLLQAGYSVTVIAKHFPGDYSAEYASPWAGAQWRTHASPEDVEQCRWDAETYQYWMKLVDREEKEGVDGAKRSGLKLFTCLHYWETQTPEIANGASSLWWRHLVKDFAIIPNSDVPPHLHYGVSFTAFAINVPQYIAYLLTQVRSLGGNVIRASLPTEGGLSGALDAAAALLSSKSGQNSEVYAFVNATGLEARKIVGDEDLYPTRGQTVLVRGEATMLQARVGDGNRIAYCIVRPGSGTTILGGTKDVRNWSCEPDDEVTRRILMTGRELCPELLNEKGDFEVLGVPVGLRPSRKGGARVEREVSRDGNGNDRVVFHNYGHGGAGYQNSVGAANKVVRLMEDAQEGEQLKAKL